MPSHDVLTVTSPAGAAAPARGTEVSGEPVRPAPFVTLHIIEDEGVLFDAGRQCAYAINATATFIWCSLESGLPPADIVRRLEQTFAITRASAAEYVDTALRNWRDCQLVTTGSEAPGSETPRSPVPRSDATPSSPSGRAALQRDADRREYLLLDAGFRVRIRAPLLQGELELLLSPLAADQPNADAMRLDLIEAENGFSVLRDGRRYASCPELDQAVPLVKTSLIELALRRSGDFGAVHAAAVSRNGRCILLAGASGAGKSTLTAALVAAGFELMADDTTVLARDTLDARPVPFAICVKQGAWELLRPRFPGIGDRPIHHRLDGKKVRYVLPSAGHSWAKPAARRPVDGLIFLNRVPETKSSVRPIMRADALSRLAGGFCPLGDGLTAEKLDQMIGWMGRIDCLELNYSPLDEGVEQIAKLCT
jgi:hypothetical protein